MTEITNITPQQEAEQKFSQFLNKISNWQEQAASIKVESEHDLAEMDRAKTLRIEIRDVRVAAEKTKKELKADALAYGKAVDNCYNTILEATKPLEALLKEKEDFVKIRKQQAAEILRLEREKEIAPFILEDQAIAGLDTMDEDTYALLLSGLKAEAQARKEAEQQEAEAAKIAEEKRIDELAEAKAKQIVESKETLIPTVTPPVAPPAKADKPIIAQAREILTVALARINATELTVEQKNKALDEIDATQQILDQIKEAVNKS